VEHSLSRNILVLDGHPDPSDSHFVHALAKAYCKGAEERNEVRLIRLADLQFPLLRSQAEFEDCQPVEVIRECQEAIQWAMHVVIVYPLWLGGMPALLKALLEQVMRPGFAYSNRSPGRWPIKFLTGKSARIVVTMGMPAFVYRWYFRAHSVRSLQRNILRFVGFRRVRTTLIGGIASLDRAEREHWLETLRKLGRDAK
jgi:putative NADPH-quinone reductase